MSNSRNCIGIVGVGVMGEALLAGVINSGSAPSTICIADKRAERLNELQSKYGVNPSDIAAIAGKCDVILLVVKPQDMGALVDEMAPLIPDTTLIVTIAAGKRTSFIEERVKPGTSVIRVMPNTPTLVGKGMAAISSGTHATEEDVDFVTNFLAACGEVIVLAEELQDAVTAVSGSGPAYFFYFVEEMVKAAIALGLSEFEASKLTIQTISGAAAMLNESGKSPTTLRENVTSPKGTTAAALASFTDAKTGEIIAAAMKAARDRSQELA